MKRVTVPLVLLFVVSMISALMLTGCTSAKTDTMPATDNPVPVAAAPPPAPVPVASHARVRRDDIDDSVFYDELSPYGRWTNDDQYGDVWMPSRVEAGWRPYSHGYWSNTNEGWAWVSDEQFGWATYHYGRWHYSNDYGWEWVPGTVWAPAWVAWRDSPGYVGWAPLPPQAVWTVGVGFGTFDYNGGIDSSWYNFVPERRFSDRRLNVVIELPARNVTYFGNSRNITNYTVANNRVINNGVAVAQIEQATGRRVAQTRIVDANSPQQARGQDRAGTVTMFRPQVPDKAPSNPPTRAANSQVEQPQARVLRQQQEQKNLQQQQTQETTRLVRQQQADVRQQTQQARAAERQAQPQRQVRTQGQVQPGRIVQPTRPAPAAPAQDVKKQQAVERQAHDARWQQEQQAMKNRHAAETQGKLPPPPLRQAAPPQRAAPAKQNAPPQKQAAPPKKDQPPPPAKKKGGSPGQP